MEQRGGRRLSPRIPRTQAPRQGIGEAKRLEDDFCKELVVWGGPCRIRCAGGCVIEDAVVKDYGAYSILIETAEGEELLFRHAILAIARMSEDQGESES